MGGFNYYTRSLMADKEAVPQFVSTSAFVGSLFMIGWGSYIGLRVCKAPPVAVTMLLIGVLASEHGSKDLLHSIYSSVWPSFTVTAN